MISVFACRFAILIVSSTFPGVSASAQAIPGGSQLPPLPVFDIVSIHPVREEDRTPTHITNPAHRGYIKASNVNLKALMEVAYDIPDIRMLAGPNWLNSERFSLEAKADPVLDEQIASLPDEQAKQLKRKMLASLLADRFKFAVRTETRDMPAYTIIVAKSGSKLEKTKAGNDTTSPGSDQIDIRAGSNSLEILAYELSWRLGRPVLDRTGLKDQQPLMLRWRDNEAAEDSTAPSLFTALQEQLGLKLESTRSSVPVLIIDHAEEPTEN